MDNSFLLITDKKVYIVDYLTHASFHYQARLKDADFNCLTVIIQWHQFCSVSPHWWFVSQTIQVGLWNRSLHSHLGHYKALLVWGCTCIFFRLISAPWQLKITSASLFFSVLLQKLEIFSGLVFSNTEVQTARCFLLLLLLQYPLCSDFRLHVQSQDLQSMIPVSPFQYRIFYD